MPSTNDSASERREAIRQLLLQEPQPNQQNLVERLRRLGYGATQSSVSRDLSFLGAVKTVHGYELPGASERSGDLPEIAGLLRAIAPAGPNLLVIKTATGAAQRVALFLDRRRWPEITGTIAGDDTVFVATATASDQRLIAHRLNGNRTRQGANSS